MTSSAASTKCLAISFVKQTQTPSCAMNIFDLFMSFKYINITGQKNPWLSQAVQNCYLLGHFEPYVLLVGGSDYHLQVVKLSWMRTQLKSPFGFTIESISDAGGLLMQRVPQYRTMRLEEVICQLIWQNTQFEATCTMSTLLTALQKVYADLHMRQPSQEAIRLALSALVSAGAVYFSGHGYSLLTPDKLAVVKWLENVPETVTLSEEDSESQSSDKAPLAEAEPYQISTEITEKTVESNPELLHVNNRQLFVPADTNNPLDTVVNQSTYECLSPLLAQTKISRIGSPIVSRASVAKQVSLDSCGNIQPSRLSQSVTGQMNLTSSPVSASYPVRSMAISVVPAPLLAPDVPVHCGTKATVTQPPPIVPKVKANQRSLSADPFNRSATPGKHGGTIKVRGSKQPLFKWILDRFRRLKTTTRHCEGNPKVVECDQRHQSKLEMVHDALPHQKSHSIAIPDHWHAGLDHTRPPLTPVEVQLKQSNLGNLRRCFSLAEDGVNKDVTRPGTGFQILPSSPLGIVRKTISGKHNSALFLRPSLNVVNEAKWISHQDLLGSPSYLSLIARPSSSQKESTFVQNCNVPSQSASHILIPGSVEHLSSWRFEPPQRHQFLQTPMNVVPIQKRPATRDSGFVESECANAQLVSSHDRSVVCSVSSLSRSPDGHAILTTERNPWATVNQQSPHTWWTTGFQHSIPLVLPSDHRPGCP